MSKYTLSLEERVRQFKTFTLPGHHLVTDLWEEISRLKAELAEQSGRHRQEINAYLVAGEEASKVIQAAANERVKASEAELSCLEAENRSLKCVYEQAELAVKELKARLAKCEATKYRLRVLISDDTYACTFQSFGSYRTALLAAMKEG